MVVLGPDPSVPAVPLATFIVTGTPHAPDIGARHVREPGDQAGLEPSSLRLLGSAVLGRVAVSTAALPTILPVNFRFDGRQILFRTGRRTKLDAATRNAVVAFEVDDVEPIGQAGWSVVVTGAARELSDPSELAEAQSPPLVRWAPGVYHRVVAISTDVVSGRRIVPGRPALIETDTPGAPEESTRSTGNGR